MKLTLKQFLEKWGIHLFESKTQNWLGPEWAKLKIEIDESVPQLSTVEANYRTMKVSITIYSEKDKMALKFADNSFFSTKWGFPMIKRMFILKKLKKLISWLVLTQLTKVVWKVFFCWKYNIWLQATYFVQFHTKSRSKTKKKRSKR